MSISFLTIKNLSVSIQETPILCAVSLSVYKNTVHVLMGPNGSGKSTLAHVLMGDPTYQVTDGSIMFNGTDITQLPPEKRSQLGIFVSFQHPPTLPGVKARTLLYELHRVHAQQVMKTIDFINQLKDYCLLLGIDENFLERHLNDGFSGGEKKRFELLQMLVICPFLVVLDEIDSGLDVDGLKVVARAIALLRKMQPELSVILITHYQRLLEHITPDYVHVMHTGTLVKTGDIHLVRAIEERGYE